MNNTFESTFERTRAWTLVLVRSILTTMLVLSILLLVTCAVAGPLLFRCDQEALTGTAYVLNGGLEDRPFRAAELFNDGFVNRVVIARATDSPSTMMGITPNITDAAVEVMVGQGVPRESIDVLSITDGTSSTAEEAIAIAKDILSHDLQSAILVTSGYHSRRSVWVTQKRLEGYELELSVVCSRDLEFDETNWWQHEDGVSVVVLELVKLVFYIFHHR